MSKKIKYQGKVYILESSLEQIMKEKLTEKMENTIDDVLGNNKEEKVVDAPLEETIENEDVDNLAPAPVGEEIGNGDDIKIEGAIEAVKSSLGLTNISEDNLTMLKLTLGDIISEGGVAPSPEVDPTLTEAPDTILHEGRIFKKVGKISEMSPMMESTTVAPPKSIRVGGKIFNLCESK